MERQHAAAVRDATGRSARTTCPREPTTAIATPMTVHALLLLYAQDEAGADAGRRGRGGAAAARGRRGPPPAARPRLDDNGISREHFGFADGLSQPVPYDEDGAVTRRRRSDGQPPRTRGRACRSASSCIGYTNGHHEKAPGPVVPDDPRSARRGRAAAARRAEGFFDFGLNGSYMVVRELQAGRRRVLELDGRERRARSASRTRARPT